MKTLSILALALVSFFSVNANVSEVLEDKEAVAVEQVVSVESNTEVAAEEKEEATNEVVEAAEAEATDEVATAAEEVADLIAE